MLNKLYDLMDSIESTSFVWNDFAYQCHVESACMALGEYEGHDWIITKNLLDWWVLTNRDTDTTEEFDNMFDAVRMFIKLQPRPELT